MVGDIMIVTINMDSFKTNKKIKLNNLYLDNSKQIPTYTTSLGRIPSCTNVSNSGANNTNIYHVQATEKRRIRKLYLDNKKKDKFKGVVHRNKNVSASTSSANMSKKSKLQTHPSHLNVRTPLSNISNVMDISNNSFQSPLSNSGIQTTPLPNIRLDSNDKFKGDVYRNNNIFASKSSANTSKQPMLQTPPSHLNIGTPLSNFSNDNTNIFSNADTSNKSSTITSRSSSVMLTNPNHKDKKKRPNLTPIPIIGLRSDQDKSDGQNDQNIYNGISKDYLDHGDQIVVCQTCFAKLWKDESVRCKKMKMKIILYNAPSSYENLFRSGDSKNKHFMKNIHSYTSMFSFTSMGGKIDSSINRGNASYIFRLSGQNYHSIKIFDMCLKWKMKCKRKRMELKRCKKDIDGILTPLQCFGNQLNIKITVI
uniref:Uncharacterized protein n=1 Tax=Lactuca sativa TaxID=4236 RepID=A0A9R1VUX1_LACSA|nr:hypothetical protein LSAT_V11C400203450 [Lactuca sativa]